MSEVKERPEEATDEVLEYLDDLRDSSVTNMFGAAEYLVDEFGFEKKVARAVLFFWMNYFGERHPESD